MGEQYVTKEIATSHTVVNDVTGVEAFFVAFVFVVFTSFFVLFFGTPQRIEGAERSKDRSTKPGGVLLGGRDADLFDDTIKLT